MRNRDYLDVFFIVLTSWFVGTVGWIVIDSVSRNEVPKNENGKYCPIFTFNSHGVAEEKTGAIQEDTGGFLEIKPYKNRYKVYTYGSFRTYATKKQLDYCTGMNTEDTVSCIYFYNGCYRKKGFDNCMKEGLDSLEVKL